MAEAVSRWSLCHCGGATPCTAAARCSAVDALAARALAGRLCLRAGSVCAEPPALGGLCCAQNSAELSAMPDAAGAEDDDGAGSCSTLCLRPTLAGMNGCAGRACPLSPCPPHTPHPAPDRHRPGTG